MKYNCIKVALKKKIFLPIGTIVAGFPIVKPLLSFLRSIESNVIAQTNNTLYLLFNLLNSFDRLLNFLA